MRRCRNEQPFSGDEVAESGSPQVVVVEDLDSYSLIDISGDAPVVSYMTKDASSMEYPLPVPLGPQLPPSSSPTCCERAVRSTEFIPFPVRSTEFIPFT